MTNVKVAVVDDDASVRCSLGRLMRSAQLHVDLYASAEEFLDAADNALDCLIVDVHMPGINGVELQRSLRRRTPDLPVLFVTAHDHDAIRHQAFAGGAAGWFAKPLDAERLYQAVVRQISERRPVGHLNDSIGDGNQAMEENTVVYFVGQDQHSDTLISDVANQMGRPLQCFATLEEFLLARPVTSVADESADSETADESPAPACVVIDAGAAAAAPDFALHSYLQARKLAYPVIVVADRLDVSTSQQWWQQGAFAVLDRNTASQQWTKVVSDALREDKYWRPLVTRMQQLQRIEQALSDRERRILKLLVEGALNRTIARKLDLSVRMIETHRAQLLRKFGVKTAPQLAAAFTECRVLSQTLLNPLQPTETQRHTPSGRKTG